MANLEDVKPINQLIIEIDGNEYVFTGGSSGPLPPDSVGTEQIIDGAVVMDDLNNSVKDKIQKTYDEDDETLHMDFDESDVNNSNQEVGQGGSEDTDDDDETGFETIADDGEGDI